MKTDFFAVRAYKMDKSQNQKSERNMIIFFTRQTRRTAFPNHDLHFWSCDKSLCNVQELPLYLDDKPVFIYGACLLAEYS